MQPEIPKRIIQVWGGGEEELPIISRASMANIQALNPDFEYLFFNDRDIYQFVANQFPQYQQIFESFEFPIQRYDFFRYLAIYHFGGFYFDLDVFFAKSLSALLEYGCVFTFEELTIYEFLRRRHNMDWEIANYGFGASAEHPFLKEIIINCAKSQLEPEWAAEMLSSIPFFFQKEFKILCTTGPGMVTRTLAENLHIAKTVKLLFPDDVRDKSNWHCFGDIAVHLQSASWRSRKDFIKRKLSGYWEIMTRKKLYKKSCLLGECRSIDSLV